MKGGFAISLTVFEMWNQKGDPWGLMIVLTICGIILSMIEEKAKIFGNRRVQCIFFIDCTLDVVGSGDGLVVFMDTVKHCC